MFFEPHAMIQPRYRTVSVFGIGWITVLAVLVCGKWCMTFGNISTNPSQTGQRNSIERGKQISKHVTAEELHEAYEELKIEYNERVFGSTSASAWSLLKESPDQTVQVSLLTHPSDPSCPYVKIQAILPGTISDTWSYLSLGEKRDRYR